MGITTSKLALMKFFLKQWAWAFLLGLACMTLLAIFSGVGDEFRLLLLVLSITLIITILTRKRWLWIVGVLLIPLILIILFTIFEHSNRIEGLDWFYNFGGEWNPPPLVFAMMWILTTFVTFASIGRNKRDLFQLGAAWASSGVLVFLFMSLNPSIAITLSNILSPNTYVINGYGNLVRNVSEGIGWFIAMFTGTFAISGGFLPFLIFFQYKKLVSAPKKILTHETEKNVV